ncbi:MAG: Rrf2 family transcriptional regulator, partial [Candidatus Omnitrophota bacterium]
GKGGGFNLALDSNKITIIKLIEIFQGKFTLSDHTFKKNICHDIATCPLKKMLDKIEGHVRSELDQVTIAYLVDRGR